MEKFSQMSYTRPDLAAYKAELKELVQQIKGAKSWEELRTLWMAMDQNRRGLASMSSIAHIRNTADTTNEFYEGEMRYFNENMPAVNLVMKEVDAALLASPYVKDFEKEFGGILVKNMENSQRLADERLIPLQIRESELAQRYSKVSATAVAVFQGKECNFSGLLKGMQSPDRATRQEAFRAWSGLYEKIAPQLDEIYDEMVKVRTRMSAILGFGSYTEMAYLSRRRFDYNAEDAARFRKKVRDEITPVCAKVYEKQRARLGLEQLHWYDESLVFPEGNADPEGTKEQLLQKALEMYRELSPKTGEFFQFMMEGELFDLESKPGKRLGGYCTSLPSIPAPFIFANFNGTAADIDVLTHEAGHAFQNYLASRTLPLTSQCFSTSEVNEIHSMAMEHFTYPWMDKFFGKNTAKHLYDHLWGALNVIPYMCCVDEFQHRMYDTPTLTAPQRREVWKELEQAYMPWRDYGESDFLQNGGFWMQKQHIFLYPFYYIEYALAQICAFQFYLRMLEDRDAAWEDYLRLCKAGGSLGYFDLLKLAHLESPFQDGTVEKIAAVIDKQLEKMEAAL